MSESYPLNSDLVKTKTIISNNDRIGKNYDIMESVNKQLKSNSIKQQKL